LIYLFIYLDMDCDGLKKALLMDTDGTLLGQAGSAISQADYLWGKNIKINSKAD
jgi:hypothetical protein